jgi:hypothetical protein
VSANLSFLTAIRRHCRSAALVLVILLMGCGDDYGQLEREEAITESFKNLRVPPTLDYYYYGVNNRCYAIAGLDPIYQIPSEFWQPIEPKIPRFQSMVLGIWQDHDLTAYGARILNPQGHRIGIWYSSLPQVTVKFEAGDQVSLIPNSAHLHSR